MILLACHLACRVDCSILKEKSSHRTPPRHVSVPSRTSRRARPRAMASRGLVFVAYLALVFSAASAEEDVSDGTMVRRRRGTRIYSDSFLPGFFQRGTRGVDDATFAALVSRRLPLTHPTPFPSPTAGLPTQLFRMPRRRQNGRPDDNPQFAGVRRSALPGWLFRRSGACFRRWLFLFKTRRRGSASLNLGRFLRNALRPRCAVSAARVRDTGGVLLTGAWRRRAPPGGC